MRWILFTIFSLLELQICGRKVPPFEVRPDWTEVPQGERILPRLNDTLPLDGAKRREIIYGPYSLSGGDMLSKFNVIAKPPCRDCFVTAIQATARYHDGREVLTSDGVWLHHAVLTSLGRRSQASTPLGRNVLWAGGNERPTLRLNTRYRYGIDWPNTMNILVEFMSETEQDTRVALAVTYEYIEKSQPEAEDYRDAYLKWNSVGSPSPREGQYQFKSPSWTVPMSGVLLHAAAHMHDGGSNVDLYINNQRICSSWMYYGGRKGYGNSMFVKGEGIMNSLEPQANPQRHSNLPSGNSLLPSSHPALRKPSLDPRQEHGHNSFGGTHISDPGHCTSFGHVREGDKMHIVAYYDATQHPMMKHQGEAEDLMGNMRVWIGPDEE